MYKKETQDVGLVLFSGVESLSFKVPYPESRNISSKRSFNRENENKQEDDDFEQSHGVDLKCLLIV